MGTHDNNERNSTWQGADGGAIPPGAHGLWSSVDAELQALAGGDDYRRYLSELRFIAEVEGEVLVTARTPFVLSRIGPEQQRLIQRVWAKHDPRARRVRLTHWQEIRESFEGLITNPWAAKAKAEAALDAGEGEEDEACAEMTFDTLVEGGSNERAISITHRIRSGTKMPTQSIYIHGPQGTGKTHLLMALLHAVRRDGSKRRIVYMFAEEFVAAYVKGAIERDTRALKERLRTADILLVDDMQALCEKPKTNDEFRATLKSVIARGGIVVMTGDRPMGNLAGLSPALSNELRGASAIEISMPDEEMRRQIVRTHADLLAAKSEHFEVDEALVERICKRVRGPGRDLFGALGSLYVECDFGAVPPTATMLDTIIERQQGVLRKPSIEQVKRATCKLTGLTKADLESPSKAQAVCYPRMLAMYLSRDMTQKSYPRIGRSFGNRDHTTVLYAVRKIAKRMQDEPEVAEAVERLREAVREVQNSSPN